MEGRRRRCSRRCGRCEPPHRSFARTCRKSFELLCEGGFEPALAAAVEAHASFLELSARRADALAVLVFVYGAGLDEWTATLEGWSTPRLAWRRRLAPRRHVGSGVDPKARPARAAAACLWQARRALRMRQRRAEWPPRQRRRRRRGLPWEPHRQRQWSRVLGACAAAIRSQPGKPDARCVLRTVAEQTRSQTHPQPYRDLGARGAARARRRRAASRTVRGHVGGRTRRCCATTTRPRSTLPTMDAPSSLSSRSTAGARPAAAPLAAAAPPRRAAPARPPPGQQQRGWSFAEIT